MLKIFKRLAQSKKAKIIFAGGCLVVITALITGSWFFVQHRNVATSADIEALRLQVRKLDSEKKYDQSLSAINKIQKKRMSNTLRAQVDSITATHYIILKDYKSIIEWANKAADVDPNGMTYSYARVIGEAYVGLGDKQAAIDYFTKAINAAKSDRDISNDSYIPALQMMIANLGPNGNLNNSPQSAPGSAAAMFKQVYTGNVPQ